MHLNKIWKVTENSITRCSLTFTIIVKRVIIAFSSIITIYNFFQPCCTPYSLHVSIFQYLNLRDKTWKTKFASKLGKNFDLPKYMYCVMGEWFNQNYASILRDCLLSSLFWFAYWWWESVKLFVRFFFYRLDVCFTVWVSDVCVCYASCGDSDCFVLYDLLFVRLFVCVCDMLMRDHTVWVCIIEWGGWWLCRYRWLFSWVCPNYWLLVFVKLISFRPCCTCFWMCVVKVFLYQSWCLRFECCLWLYGDFVKLYVRLVFVFVWVQNGYR